MKDGDKNEYANTQDAPDDQQSAAGASSKGVSQALAELAPQSPTPAPAEKLTLDMTLKTAARAIGQLPSKLANAIGEGVAFFRNINVPLTPEELPKYQIGNIQYDKKGLARLFFWMLFATVFIGTLFESGVQPVIQYWYNEFNYNPSTFGWFGSVSTVLGFVLGPVISTWSDRHRGPRGRRIPFMVYSAPFVAVGLLVLAFSRDIGGWLFPMIHLHFPAVTDEQVRMGTICTINLCVTVIGMFGGTVGYYLLNDVVPRAFVTRFLAYSQMVAMPVSFAFNQYGYPYTNSMDPKRGSGIMDFGFFQWHGVWGQLLIIVGAVGMIIYAAACLKIKEPGYPPPPKHIGDKPGLASTIQTYFKECYSNKFYLMVFLSQTAYLISSATGGYQNYLWLDIGMDAKTIGLIGNVSLVGSFCLLGIVASLSAKVNPVRLYLYAVIGLVLTCPIGFAYLIPGLSYHTYLTFRYAYVLTHIPVNIIMNLAWPVMFMTLLPKARFGQFSAAGGMITTVLGFVLGWVANNVFMQGLQDHLGKPASLRYVHVWSFIFLVISLALYIWVYRQWKKMGADKYTPPRTWREDDPPPMTVTPDEPAAAVADGEGK
jgi:MFS family permease